ncbi:MAG: hypothetical protein Q9168_001551 [Polycauliona sp. 1 TL-2023]
MADGSQAVRKFTDSPSVDAGQRRQELPDLIISPGVMVMTTQSGTKAIVTAAPTHFTGVYSVLSTDPSPSPSPPSTTAAPTPDQPAASTPSVQAAPSPHLSNAKLAAAIVVPLVLLIILAPIIIIFYINRRRKRQAAKRRSDRSTKALIEHYHGSPKTPRHHSKRAVSNPPPRKTRKPPRIVSVPTPTFSSFNFELSRPSSVRPRGTLNEPASNGFRPRGRRSATFSWGAPPPYTSQTHDTYSSPPTTRYSTPIPRLDTPSVTGSHILETAEMVHLRPISGQQAQLRRSISRQSSAVRSNTGLTQLYHPSQQQARDTLVPPPDTAWTRHGSADSTTESLQHRSTLQRPFSFHGLPSPTFSDVSGLSFDPYLMYPDDKETAVSPIEDEDHEDEKERMRPHQVV